MGDSVGAKLFGGTVNGANEFIAVGAAIAMGGVDVSVASDVGEKAGAVGSTLVSGAVGVTPCGVTLIPSPADGERPTGDSTGLDSSTIGLELGEKCFDFPFGGE